MLSGRRLQRRTPIETLDLAWLSAAALATSALTATIGLGGGVVLLAVMLLYFEPLAALPLHGLIQLVSNGSRTAIQFRHVRWRLCGPFAVLLLPGAYLGFLAHSAVPPDIATAGIGAFVLLATWVPRALLLGADPGALPERPRFFALGGLVGFLSTTLGATGPVQGPFFMGLGLDRQGVVGSFAACQTLGHLGKIAVFAAAGFAFADHGLLLAVMCATVVAGTWLGSLLLERVSEQMFRGLYRIALTLIALRLVLWNGLASWWGLVPVSAPEH